MSGFGAGLGTVAGSSLAAGDLSSGLSAVNGTSMGFQQTTDPYDTFGRSFMPAASNVGGNIAGAAGGTQSYDDFMKNYTNTPAAQYQLQQANQTTNSSAAAKGNLLSGSNLRNLSTIDNGIVSTGANNAYNEYLAGNNQQFGQLTSAFSSLLGGVGVGTTATGQQAGVDASQIGATSQIAQAQAKNDQSKGSGIGSMFSGLGSFAAAF